MSVLFVYYRQHEYRLALLILYFLYSLYDVYIIERAGAIDLLILICCVQILCY